MVFAQVVGKRKRGTRPFFPSFVLSLTRSGRLILLAETEVSPTI
jgi:hypothetical protein